MNRFLIGLILLVALVPSLFGQSRTVRTGIDVTDVEAYRMFFVEYSNFQADPKVGASAKAQMLRPIHLAPEDEEALRKFLPEFSANLNKTAATHAATIVPGKSVEDFRPARDQLVNQEVQRLNGLLSDHGDKLYQYIHSERFKRTIRIITSGGGN